MTAIIEGGERHELPAAGSTVTACPVCRRALLTQACSVRELVRECGTADPQTSLRTTHLISVGYLRIETPETRKQCLVRLDVGSGWPTVLIMRPF